MSATAKKLFEASGFRGDFATVANLLKTATKDDLDYSPSFGSTSLHEAAERGSDSIVEILVKAGANLEKKGAFGRTPLLTAIDRGHAKTAKILAEAGSDVNTCDTFGETAFATAVSRGSAAIVQLLIDAGADIHGGSKGRSPLFSAISRGNLEIVKALVAAGMDSYAPPSSNTPLMTAVTYANLAIVQFLLDQGANKDAVNEDLESPLILAHKLGHHEIAKLLEDAGANPALRNKDGMSAFDFAVSREYELLVKQVTATAQRSEMSQRLVAAQAALAGAVAEFADFDLISSLGKALMTLEEESAQLPLSEEAYLALPTRHAALVQQLTDKCRELAKAREFDALDRVAVQLETLTAMEIPAFTAAAAVPATPPTTDAASDETEEDSALPAGSFDLEGDCDLIVHQVACLPERRDMNARLALAQLAFDVADAEGTNFRLIASLGKSLQALQQESAQLPLSEEDFLTLPARHANMVRTVAAVAKALISAKSFEELPALGAMLHKLKALKLTDDLEQDAAETSADLSALPPPPPTSAAVVEADAGQEVEAEASQEVAAAAEEDCVNDPVLVIESA